MTKLQELTRAPDVERPKNSADTEAWEVYDQAQRSYLQKVSYWLQLKTVEEVLLPLLNAVDSQ